MFLTRREPGVPLSLFRPYPLPFSPPFLLYCSIPCSLPFRHFLLFSPLLCFWPAGNLEWSIPFLFFLSVSLIYICSFRGGILSVVFPAVAICFWPAGNLECPCLFSDLILFPFLLFFFYCSLPFLFFYVFSLIYICCSFRGGILSAKYPQGTFFFSDSSLRLIYIAVVGQGSIQNIFFHSSTGRGGTLWWAWKISFFNTI